jgi:hypothetical protein
MIGGVLALVAGVIGLVPAVAFAGAPAPDVSFDEERIEFAPGTDNATRSGNVDIDGSDRWILRATFGNATYSLTVSITGDAAAPPTSSR